MSTTLAVLAAIETLIRTALPNADVVGLDNESAAPTKLAPGGRVVIRRGDPGEPEVTLGVLTYSYSHRVPLELTAYAGAGDGSARALDAMGEVIGRAIEADRTLGGLVEWIEPEGLTTDEIYTPGAQTARAGDTALIADYSTSNPLT